jgi:hypothetical protein
MNCLTANLPQCAGCRSFNYVGWGKPPRQKQCWITYWKIHFLNVPIRIIIKKHIKNVYLHKALELYYPGKFEELSKLLILL